ncbi:MAG: histidine kinase [Chitinophagaceae bacterium]|nr:histidine kinase [Chitinophagaceae bacterium]
MRSKLTVPKLMTRMYMAIVMLHVAIPCSFAQQPGSKSFKLLNDNEPFKINCLFKTSEGYIYAGTTNGLYSFDGINFKKINFTTAGIKDTVTAIFQDKAKQLWVGFKSGHIAKKVKGRLEYVEMEEGNPKAAITSFIQDKQNNIWFATNGEGIYYFAKNHLYLINSENGVSDLHVRTLALTSNGDVLAATDQGINICRLVNGKATVNVIGPNNGLPDYYVTTITPAGNNTYWIGMQEKGFCLYDHSSGKITLPASTLSWNYGQVNDLLVSQKSLWIATDEQGLLKQTGINTPVEVFNSVPGIQNKINHLLQDNEGNIWMSAATELTAITGNKLKLLPVYSPKVFETIHATLCDYQNNIWITTNAAVIKYSLVNGSYTEKIYSFPTLNSKTDITSLYQDINHTIWVGTMGKGILLLNPETGQSRSLSENPLLQNASILAITGRGNTVCAGGLEGVAMIFNITEKNKNITEKYRFTNYNDIENVGNNYIYSIYKDSRGRIWFGTDGKGITVLDNGKLTTYNKTNGLRDDHIYSFAEDSKGNIWFNTEGAGIYCFNGKTFKNYTDADGISDLKITALKTGPLGNIILVNKKGIDILNPERGSFSYINNKQGIGDVNTDMGSVTQDTAGNVVLSTLRGIVFYTPVEDAVDRPKTIIENVQLFLTDVEKNVKGYFKHDQNSFQFYYTGLYYTSPDEVRYQYKLDGLDTGWILTRDRNVTFPKLQPGTYKFHVRSSLNENFTNVDVVTYEFVIEKPVWKRFWFITTFIIVLLALVYGYIKRREKQLKKVQQLQQEKIQFEFQVLRNQVNPHFLFNSFNTLISYIEEDPAMAVDYVEKLSAFFRNIVNYRDQDVITLEEEIGVLRTYFYLQQKRHGKNLSLNISVSAEENKLIFIPPLTLQLLIENAIKHNAVSKETPLEITIDLQNKNRLVIRNNINPKITREPGTGTGLQNIIKRYSLLSKEFVIVNNDGAYYTVILPILHKLN